MKSKKMIKSAVALILTFTLLTQCFWAVAESEAINSQEVQYAISGDLTTTSYADDVYSKYTGKNYESYSADQMTYNERGEAEYSYTFSGTVDEITGSLEIKYSSAYSELGNSYYDRTLSEDGTETYLHSDNSNNFLNSVYGFGAGWGLSLPQIEYINPSVSYFHTGEGNSYRIAKTTDGSYRLVGFPYTYNITPNTQTDENSETVLVGFIGTDRYGNKDYFNLNGRLIKQEDRTGTSLCELSYDANAVLSAYSTSEYIITFDRTTTENQIGVYLATSTAPDDTTLIDTIIMSGDNLQKIVLDNSIYPADDDTSTTQVYITDIDETEFTYSEISVPTLKNNKSTAVSTEYDGGAKYTALLSANNNKNYYKTAAYLLPEDASPELAAMVAADCSSTVDEIHQDVSTTSFTYNCGLRDNNSVYFGYLQLESTKTQSSSKEQEGYFPHEESLPADERTSGDTISTTDNRNYELKYTEDGLIERAISYTIPDPETENSTEGDSAEEDLTETPEEETTETTEEETTSSDTLQYFVYTIDDTVLNTTLSKVNETITSSVSVYECAYTYGTDDWLTHEISQEELTQTIGRNSSGDVVYNYQEEKCVYYAYNGNGNPIKEIKQDGLTSSYTYDSRGNILLQTISDGNISRSTRNFYDNYNRVLRKIGPEQYDEAKDSLTIDSRGVCVDSFYSDTLSGEHYTYDTNDNISTYINSSGNKTINIYDSKDRLIKTTTYASITDAPNDIGALTTRYVYDADGNLIQTVYPHQYNAEKDNLDISNGVNEYTDNTIGERVTYDDDGNVTEYIDSFGKETVNTYDSNGNLVKSVSGNETTRFIYNGGDNLLQVIYPEQYNPADDNLDLTAETPVDTYLNANVGDRYTYDENGNVLTYTNTYGSVTTNTYDDEGNLVSTTKPDGTVLTFDDENRASNETYSNGFIRDFAYTSNQTVITGSNGITTTYNLNSFGEVTEYKLQNGENNKDYSYTYDSNGNITTISLNGSLQQTFTYNSSNELVRVDDAVVNKTITYEYDYVGNITAVNTYIYTLCELGTPLTTQNYDYNSQNQRTDLSYDANGNLTSLNGYTFGWTNRRLTSATSTDNSISYTYNHDGIRTSKTINGSTTYYEVDENNNVVKQYELVNDVETNVIEFVYDSNGSPIYFTYNNATYYYEKNLQDDIVAIHDANGNTVVEYTYDIWGELVSITGSLADTIGTINPLRYRGYCYDTETELYYLQSRYYSPDLMRFISQDDVKLSNTQGQPLGSNLYAYCLENPVNLSDDVGYQPEWAGAICKKAKSTWIYKYFVKATQNGWFSNLFYIAGFIRDSKGVYHARQDCWQQIAGYNDLYDWAFDLGTSMKRSKFPFNYNNKSYIFWAWKGDYLNLGAGAELGIYYGGGKHWLVDKKLALKMTLSLKHNGHTIISYSPGKVWWLTGFNPYYQNVKASKLTAVYTIDFSSKKGMFKAFYKRHRWSSGWSFNTKKYTATYKF